MFVEGGETGWLGASPEGLDPRGSQMALSHPLYAVPKDVGTLFLRLGMSKLHSELCSALQTRSGHSDSFWSERGSSGEALAGPWVLLDAPAGPHRFGTYLWTSDEDSQLRLDAQGQARPEDSHLVPESQGS